MNIKNTRIRCACCCLIAMLGIAPLASTTQHPSLAASKPTIAKKATVEIGTPKTLEVNANGYVITRIKPKSSNSIVASVKNVNSRVVITGREKGSCTITTTVRARKGKTIKNFKLKTKVTVKKVKTTSISITSFSELNGALESMQKNGGSVTLNSPEEGSFEIPKASYSKVNLVINAPNAKIVNHATFSSITIKAMKDEKWDEQASGNSFTLESTAALKLVVNAGYSVNSITLSGSVSTGVQTIEVIGSVSNIFVKDIAPADIKATADSSKIGLIEISAIGANVSVDANFGSTVSKVRALKTSNTSLTGNSTAAIIVEKVPQATVSVAETLTGVAVTEIPA